MNEVVWDWVGRAGMFLAVWALTHALGSYGWMIIGGVMLVILSLHMSRRLDKED